MEVKFILGEDKRIRLLVRSPNNEPFTIIEANYKLMIKGDVESEGACEIKDHCLDIKLSPKAKCIYTLEVTYKVSDSTRKTRIWVVVV